MHFSYTRAIRQYETKFIFLLRDDLVFADADTLQQKIVKEEAVAIARAFHLPAPPDLRGFIISERDMFAPRAFYFHHHGLFGKFGRNGEFHGVAARHTKHNTTDYK